MLKECAETLGVCIRRQLHHFGAKGIAKTELLPMYYGRGISNEAVVYKLNPRFKHFDIGMLNRKFNKAKEALDGANGAMRFMEQVCNKVFHLCILIIFLKKIKFFFAILM